jgi:exodeoxyribonuclease VII small subunit
MMKLCPGGGFLSGSDHLGGRPRKRYDFSRLRLGFRVSTPTGAAEAATPNQIDVLNGILQEGERLQNALLAEMASLSTRLEALSERPFFKNPAAPYDEKEKEVEELNKRLWLLAISRSLDVKKDEVKALKEPSPGSQSGKRPFARLFLDPEQRGEDPFFRQRCKERRRNRDEAERWYNSLSGEIGERRTLWRKRKKCLSKRNSLGSTRSLRKVENETLPIEESLKLYEEGNALIKELEATLKDAQKKIGQLNEVTK